MTINRKIDGTTHMSMTPAPLDSKPQGAQDEISRDLRTLANVYIKHGSPDYKAMIEAAERIEKLERQCETYRNAANEAHRLLQTTYDERDTALRALAEARRDAERYRWLRDGHSRTIWVSCYPETGGSLRMIKGGELDSEIDKRNPSIIPIDAARQPEKGANNG